MATVYSGYSKGWKPSGSDIYKKYRARVDYSVSAETPTTITYRAVLYVNINSAVTASYSGTLNISGTSYTGSCKTVFGEGNTVTCVSAKTKTFNKGATATTATIKGGVKSSNGSWTGATVTASATVTIPALAPATITFDANGGSGSVDAISTYVGVANTIPSNSLTRTGYTFNGWNTASDGSGTAYATGSTITPTGDVTLYAQWQTTYVKPEIQNLLAFRTADASGEASPTVTSTGETGFCKFELVGGANYTFTSATVQFGTAPAKSMTKSGTTVYGYSDVDSIAQTSAYTVKITVVVTGTDGVSRTYTDSTYISKSVPVFDVASNGNCFAFFGTATDGLTDPKLIINGEMAFGTEANAAEALVNLGGVSMEPLWENASPASVFAAQTIPLILNGYEYVLVRYLYSTDYQDIDQIAIVKVGRDAYLTFTGAVSTNIYLSQRTISVGSDSVAFGAPVYKTYASTSSPTANNKYCIPVEIIGIKGVQ